MPPMVIGTRASKSYMPSPAATPITTSGRSLAVEHRSIPSHLSPDGDLPVDLSSNLPKRHSTSLLTAVIMTSTIVVVVLFLVLFKWLQKRQISFLLRNKAQTLKSLRESEHDSSAGLPALVAMKPPQDTSTFLATQESGDTAKSLIPDVVQCLEAGVSANHKQWDDFEHRPQAEESDIAIALHMALGESSTGHVMILGDVSTVTSLEAAKDYPRKQVPRSRQGSDASSSSQETTVLHQFSPSISSRSSATSFDDTDSDNETDAEEVQYELRRAQTKSIEVKKGRSLGPTSAATDGCLPVPFLMVTHPSMTSLSTMDSILSSCFSVDLGEFPLPPVCVCAASAVHQDQEDRCRVEDQSGLSMLSEGSLYDSSLP
ncbi:hypothetical protein BD779DRAFT_1505457 [Infundibulicybe gibba]|nr:hypothetical protein BD779DRAFT_1505457 [Infundibulicybe gibba]